MAEHRKAKEEAKALASKAAKKFHLREPEVAAKAAAVAAPKAAAKSVTFAVPPGKDGGSGGGGSGSGSGSAALGGSGGKGPDSDPGGPSGGDGAAGGGVASIAGPGAGASLAAGGGTKDKKKEKEKDQAGGAEGEGTGEDQPGCCMRFLARCDVGEWREAEAADAHEPLRTDHYLATGGWVRVGARVCVCGWGGGVRGGWAGDEGLRTFRTTVSWSPLSTRVCVPAVTMSLERPS